MLEIDAPEKVVEVVIDLEGDDEPAEVYDGTRDYRYNRRYGPKFVRNGTFPVVITARTASGVTARASCDPVTVVF